MTQPESESIVSICFALGHKRRLAIFNLLIDRPDAGKTLGHLERATRLARATLIHHLRQMEKAGLIRRRQKGAETEYLLTPAGAASTADHLATRLRHPGIPAPLMRAG